MFDDEVSMTRKRAVWGVLPSLLAAGMFAHPMHPALLAQTGAPATLRLQVEPEALVRATTPLAWSPDGTVLTMPVDVLLRLSPGTTGFLTIASANSQSALAVPGETGLVALSRDPVIVRNYSRSGKYATILELRPASAESPSGQQTTVTLRVFSSDGSAEWAQTLTLPAVP
jgi:hypothetical protein